MNEKQVIVWAQEAGFEELYQHKTSDSDWVCFKNEIVKFAALVAAAKDAEHAEKLKYDIHSCGPTCTRYACVAVREAVEAERERIKQINAPEIEQVNKELRRLHEVNQELLEALKNIIAQYGTVYGIGDLEMQSAIDFAHSAIAKGEKP